MEAEVTDLVGAEPHERSAGRTTYRNGYRDRPLPSFTLGQHQAPVLAKLSITIILLGRSGECRWTRGANDLGLAGPIKLPFALSKLIPPTGLPTGSSGE